MRMKRLLLALVFSGAALLTQAVQGQSRGMGAGVRMSAPPARAGGFAARPMPTARVGAGFGARPVPAVRISPQTRFTPNHQVFAHSNGRVFFRSHGFRHFHHNRFFFNNCFNSAFFDPFVCNNGFFTGGLLSSPFYYPFDYGFDNGYSTPQSQPVVMSDEGNSRELAYEVQRLTDEVADLREDNRAARAEARQPAQGRLSATPEAENTILIFRDGHQITVQNYAIAGSTLWILSEHNAKKVAIADLDVNATEQTNAKNGVEFRVPGEPH